jgi:translation elongation factor EF-1beta
MPSYTETDLENIQQAILDLATGKRKVRVKIKNTEVEYGQVDMAKLEALEERIKSNLNGGATFIRIVTKGGFD